MRRRAPALVVVASLVAALASAGCRVADGDPTLVATTPSPDGAVSPASSTPDAVPTPELTAAPEAPPTSHTVPPPPEPWRPGPNEVEAEAKTVAARVAEALTNYRLGAAADVPAAVTDDPARRDAVRGTAAPLLDDDRWSHGRVLYAQLGGRSSDRASVMVVVEQRIGGGGDATTTTTRTLDVRLVRRDGAWAFDLLASSGGEPVPRPDDLPAEAVAVLDDDRISLPDSARWDIHAGEVDLRLLRVMAEIAERTPYGVVTLARGHPVHVFGTDRLSDHTRGRAVDIAVVADVPVVDDRHEASLTYELVDWLRSHPLVRQVGSPWALDGYGGRSFTDVVHQDHLHVAVGPEEEGVGEH